MFHQTSEIWTREDAKEKHRLDMASLRYSKLKEARAQGFAQGIAEGKVKGKREVLSILRHNGSSLAKIAKLMNLPEKNIEALLRDGD